MSVTGVWGGLSASERRSERRRRIIEAAISLYGEKGYRNTGVRAICQKAGLTERYFYEGFANSEALLAAAFDQVMRALLERIRAAADPALPDEARARAMLRAYYETLRAHPQGTRVFLVEIAGVSPTIDLAFERSLLSLTEPILDFYDKDRVGPLARQPLLRRGVAGGLLHIALAWSANEYEQELDEIVDAAMPLCLLARPVQHDPGQR